MVRLSLRGPRVLNMASTCSTSRARGYIPGWPVHHGGRGRERAFHHWLRGHCQRLLPAWAQAEALASLGVTLHRLCVGGITGIIRRSFPAPITRSSKAPCLVTHRVPAARRGQGHRFVRQRCVSWLASMGVRRNVLQDKANKDGCAALQLRVGTCNFAVDLRRRQRPRGNRTLTGETKGNVGAPQHSSFASPAT